VNLVVTGGMGVLGREVVRELLAPRTDGTAHQVTVFDHRLGPVPRGVRTVVGSHRDLTMLRNAVAGADAILHLSARHVAEGENPADVYRDNVVGVFNVHEAARIQGVRRVVHWSSVAALGWSGLNDGFMPDYLPIDEDHPLRATDAYGLSKAAGEDIAHSFTAKHGIETLALRHVYTVTPRMGFDLWRTGGKRHRRWIHYAYVDVRDAAVAARLAVEVDAPGHTALYVTADDSCAPAPLSDLLAELRPGIAAKAAMLTGTRSAISNARAKALLGWTPHHTWRTPPPLASRASIAARELAARAWGRVPVRLRPSLRKHLSLPNDLTRNDTAGDSTPGP
jgi:nucleoside-diphosphate-sugar epimerase